MPAVPILCHQLMSRHRNLSPGHRAMTAICVCTCHAFGARNCIMCAFWHLLNGEA